MERPLRLIGFAAIIAVLQCAVAVLGAAPFTIESGTVSIPENGTVSSLIVRTAQAEVSFVPPPLWKLAIDTNSSTLTWQTPDFRSMLRLRFAPGQGGSASLKQEAVRERVRADFPDAVIKDEAECFTATHPGRGFELEQRKAKFPSVTRLAFVPYEGGLLELQMACPLEHSEQTRHRFTGVMNSLRIVPR